MSVGPSQTDKQVHVELPSNDNISIESDKEDEEFEKKPWTLAEME